MLNSFTKIDENIILEHVFLNPPKALKGGGIRGGSIFELFCEVTPHEQNVLNKAYAVHHCVGRESTEHLDSIQT